MLKGEIRFLSAQPDHRHFVWQTHVYLHNFLSLGIPAPHCVALFGVDPGQVPSGELRDLIDRFPEADIRVYTDTRDAAGRGYAPTIQPHLIDKALAETPDWVGALTFFQDCDIAFRRLPDFDQMLREYPEACLLSDTRSYIGFKYLERCCEKIRAERPETPRLELIQKMCEIVGIDLELVRQNETGSGGAQYLLQNFDRPYWQKVYRDSIAIRRLFDEYLGGLGLEKEPGDYIQVWTAGMWAYLWNLWRAGLETVVHPEMSFVFSGASSEDAANILHLAGLPKELKYSHYDKADWWDENPIRVLARQPDLFDHFPTGSVAREYADLIHDAAAVEARRPAPPTPSRFWRLLVWKVESKAPIWDVERLHFGLEPGVEIVGYLESGNAGPDFGAANAFDDDSRLWGGRAEHPPGGRSHLYLGIELNRPAVPQEITLTQSGGPHATRLAVLQFSQDGATWRSSRVAHLDPTRLAQPVLYRMVGGHSARGWRAVARETSCGEAWDIRRLAFLGEDLEEIGSPCASGNAVPEQPSAYGPRNAFVDTSACWGGRANAAGLFFLGLEATSGTPVNRVLLDQSDAHWASEIEIQVLDVDDRWRPFRVVEDLIPGVNEAPLYGACRTRSWVAPRVVSTGKR